MQNVFLVRARSARFKKSQDLLKNKVLFSVKYEHGNGFLVFYRNWMSGENLVLEFWP